MLQSLHFLSSFIVNSELFYFCALILQHTKIPWENAIWITIGEKKKQLTISTSLLIISTSLLHYLWKLCYSKCTSIANALFILLTFIEAAICDKVWSLEHSIFLFPSSSCLFPSWLCIRLLQTRQAFRASLCWLFHDLKASLHTDTSFRRAVCLIWKFTSQALKA